MNSGLGDDPGKGSLLLGGRGGAPQSLAQTIRANGGATIASHPALSTGVSFAGAVSIGGGSSSGGGSGGTGRPVQQR